jgi:hypothetical protein
MEAGSTRHYLATLFRCSPAHAENYLQKPAVQMDMAVSDIDQLMPLAAKSGLKGLLMRHILSCLAMSHPLPQPSVLMFRQMLEKIIPEEQLPAPEKTAWLTFPVPVLQGNKARFVIFLLGHSPGPLSFKAALPLSTQSRQAVVTAQQTLARLNPGSSGMVVLIPLLSEHSPRIEGTSLGLPCALAIQLASEGEKWPRGLYATGSVANDGRLQTVAGVFRKQAISTDTGCFIIPDTGPKGWGTGSGSVSCQCLAQAIDAAQLYRLEISAVDINKYRHCLTDHECFLKHFKELPSHFLQHRNCRTVLDKIAQKPAQYLQSASSALHACGLDLGRAPKLVSLYTPSQLKALASASAEGRQLVFRWCLSRLAVINHCGKTAVDGEWRELFEMVRDDLEEDQELLEYFNHQFIVERWNRYFFSPEIPAEIVRLVKLEEDRNRIALRVNRSLGALYGTLAQNAGFCGPSHHRQLECYATLAEKAFGNKYTREKQRLTDYRIHAALDTEDKQRARTLLDDFLQAQSDASRPDWICSLKGSLQERSGEKPYLAHLVLKTLAELAGDGNGFHPVPDLIRLKTLQQPPCHHPWQLILYNLARLCLAAGEPQQGARFLHLAAKICLADHQKDTMKVMALLIFSLLYRAGLAERRHLDETDAIVQWLSTDTRLHRPHFALLLTCKKPGDVLEIIARNPKEYFPFKYR